jgi:nucleoside-diphosphate-sugar epimerase
MRYFKLNQMMTRLGRERDVRTKRMLITGGAGFIGCNAARFFGMRNWSITVLDNLSGQGADNNLEWLSAGISFDFEQSDIRNRPAIDRLLSKRRFDAVIHLAAQVAVTTSVSDPSTDFAVNAIGTFNVLDAVRHHCPEAVFIIPSKWGDWRPGDQQVYVSDIGKLEKVLNWKPEIDVRTGIGQLIEWVDQNRDVVQTIRNTLQPPKMLNVSPIARQSHKTA